MSTTKEMKKAICIILSIIAIVSLMSITVSAEEANVYEVTETEGKGIMRILSLEGENAYCAQMDVRRPVKGTVYTVTNYDITGIEPTCIAIFMLDDGSYDFRVATQVALWSFIEGKDCISKINQFVGATDNARVFYNQIIETAKIVNENHYVVNIQYYASEGYQVLMTMDVEKIPPVKAPAPVIPEPEVEEIVPPITEPEVEPEIPEVVPEEEIVPPVTEPEVKPEIPETVPETEPEIVPPVEEVEETEPETIPEKEPEVLADEPYYPEAPQTGDNSNITFWVILMSVSLVMVIALIATNKKHAKEEN